MFSGHMVELESMKLGFKSANFIAVCTHGGVGALPLLINLIYDDFGIAIYQEVANA